MFRIQRRSVVERSPSAAEHATVDRSAANLFGHSPSPFTLPTTHLWCIQRHAYDVPHVVLFHNAENAACMVRALVSYAKREHRLPSLYADLRDVFSTHYSEVHARGRNRPRSRTPPHTAAAAAEAEAGEDLHVHPCDLDDMTRWASNRRFGIVAVAKIMRSDALGALQVPYEITSPDPDVNIDQSVAFMEDFGHQLFRGDDDDFEAR